MSRTGGGGHERVLPHFAALPIPLSILVLACQAAAPVAEAGGGAEGPGSSATTQETRERRSLPPDIQMPPSSDSLRLRLLAPDRVVAGEPVPVTLRLENATERTLTLYLTGRSIAFDVVVERADGARVWRRLEGEVIQSILRLETLGPGEVLVLETSWDQRSNAGEPVPPGEYRVRGIVPTEGEPLVTRAESLRILPR